MITLAQHYRCAASPPDDTAKTLLDPSLYRAFWCNNSDFTDPAKAAKTNKVLTWYELDLCHFLELYPDLSQAWFHHRVATRPHQDDPDCNYTCSACRQQGYRYYHVPCQANCKPIPQIVPFQPSAGDMAIQIAFCQQELAETIAGLKRMTTAFSEVLGQQNPIDFMTELADKDRTRLTKAIDRYQGILTSLQSQWTDYGLQPDNITALTNQELAQLFDLPEVLTLEAMLAAKDRIEAARDAALIAANVFNLDDVIDAKLFKLMPERLMQQLAQKWYHDSYRHDLVATVNKYEYNCTMVPPSECRQQQNQLLAELRYQVKLLETYIARFADLE